MPVIIFEGPKLTKEQKTELVKQFTEISQKITNIPKEAFIIIIKENPPENIGVGGTLLEEKFKKQS